MSGHSKWSQIKRQKGVADARRGQLFTKFGREITVAARQGGGDPEANFRLRLAVQRARDNNMPLDNIERAIKRGVGGADAAALTEVTCEGYGPGGSAILLKVLTDNWNRTLGEVRNIFSRSGGNLGDSGCVAWMFDQKGVIAVETDKVDTEELALFAIDASADDIKVEENMVEVYTQPKDMEVVRKVLEQKEFTIISAELSFIPNTTINLDEKAALQGLRLMEKLEELDEVQHVYTNADFPDEVVSKYQE